MNTITVHQVKRIKLEQSYHPKTESRHGFHVLRLYVSDEKGNLTEVSFFSEKELEVTK